MALRLRPDVERRDSSCPSSCSTSPQPTSPSSASGRWPPPWCHPLTRPCCLQPPSSPPTSIGTSWGHRWGGGAAFWNISVKKRSDICWFSSLQASEKEIQWVIRVSVVVVGLAGTSLTFLDNSVLMIWMLRSDLTYTLMLPQLVCILFFKVSNGYGAVLGCVVGMLLRVLCGEPLLGIPPVLRFPGCTLVNGVYVQRSPIRTICMLSALVSILLFSYLAALLFSRGLIPEKWDVFNVKAEYSAQTQGGAKSDTKDRNSKEQSEDNEVCEPMLESTC